MIKISGIQILILKIHITYIHDALNQMYGYNNNFSPWFSISKILMEKVFNGTLHIIKGLINKRSKEVEWQRGREVER